MTSRCSSGRSVAPSPVVPDGTRPWIPESTCHATSLSRAGRSTDPSSRNGVTIAVIAPRRIKARSLRLIVVLPAAFAFRSRPETTSLEPMNPAPVSDPLRREHGALGEPSAAPRGVLERHRVVRSVEPDAMAPRLVPRADRGDRRLPARSFGEEPCQTPRGPARSVRLLAVMPFRDPGIVVGRPPGSSAPRARRRHRTGSCRSKNSARSPRRALRPPPPAAPRGPTHPSPSSRTRPPPLA